MFDFDSDVLWHPGAGVIDAETAVAAMLRLAEQHGAVLHSDWEVADSPAPRRPSASARHAAPRSTRIG